MVTVESWFGEAPPLAEALEVRRIVFVGEQGVPLDEEIDGKDGKTYHVLARSDGRPVGTARVFPGETAKIGRVAVLREMRGQDVGRLLMAEAHRVAAAQGARELVLDAQVQVIPFYERLGYTAEGPVFLDANIEHRTMRRPLTTGRT